jgi:hypothetical protein
MFAENFNFPTPRVRCEIDLEKKIVCDVIPEVGVVASTSGRRQNLRASEEQVQNCHRAHIADPQAAKACEILYMMK